MPDESEVAAVNAKPAEIDKILETAKIIAVVGLSEKEDRPSYQVARYMKMNGYRIIPVNPNAEEILNEKSYRSLDEIKEKIDVVDIFRKPEGVPEIVEAAIRVGARTVWMQDGIVHNEAAEKARRAGLYVVMNKCMLREHRARH